MTAWNKMHQSLAIVGLLVLAGPVTAKEIPTAKAEQVGMSTERLQRVVQMNQRYIDEGKVIGIATAVVRDGKLVHQSVLGNKGLDDPRPLAVDDLFRIYSMTKQITAVAVMQLYEQGKFLLTDPVSKFIPEFKNMIVLTDGRTAPAENEMTMHHLLTHTAGITNVRESWHAHDLDEFAVIMSKIPLAFEPGARWEYSDGAVEVTGLILERLSGQRLDKYFAENLFEPLDMTDTFFEVPADKKARFLPNHYRDFETDELVLIGPEGVSDTPEVFWEGCPVGCNYDDVSLFLGGFGLVSTLRDYVRFAEALRAGGILGGNRILSPKTINFMSMNHLPGVVTGYGDEPLAGPQGEPLFKPIPGVGYGIGFAVIENIPASGAMGSAGTYYGGGAAGTVFWIDPVEDIVVVSMMQLMNPWFSYRKDLQAVTYQAILESKEK